MRVKITCKFSDKVYFANCESDCKGRDGQYYSILKKMNEEDGTKGLDANGNYFEIVK